MEPTRPAILKARGSFADVGTPTQSMPRKPVRGSSVWVLSKGAPARLETEYFPREQKALELAIGSKFLRELQKRTGRCWVDSGRVNDFETT